MTRTTTQVRQNHETTFQKRRVAEKNANIKGELQQSNKPMPKCNKPMPQIDANFLQNVQCTSTNLKIKINITS